MQISCPNCNQKYDIDSSLTGQNAECDKCGEKFIIQDLEELTLPKQPFVRETKMCPMCGEMILAVAKKCRYCQTTFFDNKAKKTALNFDRTAYTILAFFLGGLGAHNFYVKRTGAACFNIALSFLALPSFGITALVNFIFIILNICADPNNIMTQERWKKWDNQYFGIAVFLFVVFFLLLLGGIGYEYCRSIL